MSDTADIDKMLDSIGIRKKPEQPREHDRISTRYWLDLERLENQRGVNKLPKLIQERERLAVEAFADRILQDMDETNATVIGRTTIRNYKKAHGTNERS